MMILPLAAPFGKATFLLCSLARGPHPFRKFTSTYLNTGQVPLALPVFDALFLERLNLNTTFFMFTKVT